MRSTSQPYEALVTRADGKGSVRIGNGYDAATLQRDLEAEFERDHSITMAWVRHKHRNTLGGELLARDPPGLNPTGEEG